MNDCAQTQDDASSLGGGHSGAISGAVATMPRRPFGAVAMPGGADLFGAASARNAAPAAGANAGANNAAAGGGSASARVAKRRSWGADGEAQQQQQQSQQRAQQQQQQQLWQQQQKQLQAQQQVSASAATPTSVVVSGVVEQPFVCAICGNSYAMASDLAIHTEKRHAPGAKALPPIPGGSCRLLVRSLTRSLGPLKGARPLPSLGVGSSATLGRRKGRNNDMNEF